MNGQFKLTHFVISKTSVEKSLEVAWEDVDCLRVELNCLRVVALLPCGVPLRVVLLCQLLLLL